MIWHITAFVSGFILDLILGDPYRIFHPIRIIGNLIAKLENKWNCDEPQKALKKGRFLVFVVTGSTVVTVAAILVVMYRIHRVAGVVTETIMTYQILATKCLKKESMKVYYCLKKGDIPKAKKAVSMIVGRNTESLDDIGITKAAVETVAENTSDGVIAPMIYTAIGGPILGFFYKAVNTMDSMVGYKNERYLWFGRCAAKFDDIVNFIPSRISAILMIISCLFLGKEYSFKEALRIHKRDSRNQDLRCTLENYMKSPL